MHSKIRHAKNMRKPSKHAKDKKPEFLGFRAGFKGNVLFRPARSRAVKHAKTRAKRKNCRIGFRV